MIPACDQTDGQTDGQTESIIVWELPGDWGFNPPVHLFNPPSLIYSFVLGGQKITPPDCTCIVFVPS